MLERDKKTKKKKEIMEKFKISIIDFMKENGNFTCPDCGSTNTGSSTYSDYCNDCDYGYSYMRSKLKA